MNSQRFNEMLATFFYLGRAPLMPGTFGTLGAIPLVFIFNLFGTYGYMAATFVLCIFAIWVAEQYEQMVQDHDTKEVVIDEVAGFLVTMFWLPHTWQSFLAGFVLFRFLDIAKPFPINIIDRRAKGGFGTVADDLVAGVIANLVLQFVYTQTPWLGEQWKVVGAASGIG
jgi:phosphatidylglycerophosphatase A